MSLLAEAREIIRTNPLSLKIGHLKKCADAADKAYRELVYEFTRDTAQTFTAHCARLVLAIEMVIADQPTAPRGAKQKVPVQTEIAAQG